MSDSHALTYCKFLLFLLLNRILTNKISEFIPFMALLISIFIQPTPYFYSIYFTIILFNNYFVK